MELLIVIRFIPLSFTLPTVIWVPALLQSSAITNVTNFLNDITNSKKLKVAGVRISINYPILVTSYAQSANYLTFYENVVNLVRAKKLKLYISCQATQNDTQWVKLNVTAAYNGLKTATYKTLKTTNASNYYYSAKT